MKVKFKDGTIRNCTVPVEQKVFKNSEPAGWVLVFTLLGEITSDEVDSILKTDNITELTFIPEPVGGMDEIVEVTEGEYIKLLNYDKITTSAIRYAEDVTKTRVEIQLSKGV